VHGYVGKWFVGIGDPVKEGEVRAGGVDMAISALIRVNPEPAL
jgi:hypothetical protein